jgi:ubiquinone biosynthesis protein
MVEARLIRQTTTTPAPQQKPHPVWWMIGGGALVGCGVLIGALL